MPAEIYGERYHFLPKNTVLTFEETTRLAKLFVGLGVRKLRLTGGEPLLRQDVEQLVSMLSGIDGLEDLSMTTNGSLLTQKAQALKDAGLQRITVSMDSLDDAVFKQMSGRNFLPRHALEGIRAAEDAGLSPIKINCVVQKGVNDHTIVDLARHFKGTGHIVRYIEFMDVGTLNKWDLAQVMPAREVVERISAEMPLEPVDKNYPGEVANRYRYIDGTGEIGVIASVTQPFCQDCTRGRLSAEGELVTCLFANSGTDLKTPMRAGASDEDLIDMITGVWQRRQDRYSELRSSLTSKQRELRKVEMYHIGG
ncbi:MAG: cyclic pyranopterin phosphate synthase [Chloroflexi bacterium]|jgi:cyclic pyranopterin phosphate synthase|nr:MAG: cyclic pyranopterin phosphate synthase [Chloroflexota bacterium]